LIRRANTLENGDILPSRDVTLKVLKDLADGKISREDAADWASEWVRQVDESDFDIDDEIVWDAIETLSGADMKTIDRPYLFDSVDFRAWYEEFVCKTGESELK
jgi:hypothetical protein